jgi:hypothetical protein
VRESSVPWVSLGRFAGIEPLFAMKGGSRMKRLVRRVRRMFQNVVEPIGHDPISLDVQVSDFEIERTLLIIEEVPEIIEIRPL